MTADEAQAPCSTVIERRYNKSPTLLS